MLNQIWKPSLVSHGPGKQQSDRTSTRHVQEDAHESYILYFRMDNLETNWNGFSHVAKILNHLKSWWTDLKLDQNAHKDSQVVDILSLDCTGREAERSK